VTLHSKKNSLQINQTELPGVNIKLINPESPHSKQDYDSEDVDEHSKSCIMKLPRGSPERSPSKRPFSYSFAGGSEKGREGYREYRQMSFVDKVKEYNYTNSINNDNLNAITPSTKAGSDMRKNSCFSCADQKFEENFKVPKDKVDRGKIKTKKMKAYLEKAKSLKNTTYSPLSKQSNSVHSILEAIDEEGSSVNSQADGLSNHTADPRYFSKNQYTEVLSNVASVNRERPSYSILAKKLSDDDLLMHTTMMKKSRSTMHQPRQQYLLRNKGYKDVRRFHRDPHWKQTQKF